MDRLGSANRRDSTTLVVIESGLTEYADAREMRAADSTWDAEAPAAVKMSDPDTLESHVTVVVEVDVIVVDVLDVFVLVVDVLDVLVLVVVADVVDVSVEVVVEEVVVHVTVAPEQLSVDGKGTLRTPPPQAQHAVLAMCPSCR
mmetsp:Transcript_75411/g.194425  ORF Transcript_75411/g.194425 Transcript_75411/m.194425 type:complete len:144 (+) Transcript_75411:111-542(+)|eukprot:CAMPEP_0195152614 /NCGR_PEP_ID=MMETSP0448-20130528/182643_1 /TAXON_ID=66468 /ORGANISM="Heterocapsa triquestra, Strain CCMP 448" /LENGTH=143 /DNA_ID=CAMNT_0040191377 /DNA_START=107 /DNA_END=538 /DNA_ORIENTATION=+